MTTRVLFPDTSVAVTFAAVDRVDLLITWLGNRGSFCDAVWREMKNHAASKRSIDSLISQLGEPVELTEDEEENAEMVRRSKFGGSETAPTKHLGEAHTLVLLRRPVFSSSSTWISDDIASRELAEHQRIRVLDSVGVLIDLVGYSELAPEDALTLWEDMYEKQRGVPLPTSLADIRKRAGV